MGADVAIAILVLLVVVVVGILWLIKLKGSATMNDQ